MPSENGHYQVVELLLKENADPNFQDKEGRTALMLSIEKGYYRVAKLLLKENTNHNLQDLDGWTALMFASKKGNSQVVELLIKENANHIILKTVMAGLLQYLPVRMVITKLSSFFSRKTSIIIYKTKKVGLR